MMDRRQTLISALRVVVVASCGLGLAGGAGAITPVTPKPPEHPSAYFKRAAEAWAAGDGDTATFWLYFAQLRYRAYLAAHPDLDPTGDPALFSAMLETVGRPINEYAFGDIPNATLIIDRVLRYDDGSPDTGIPEAIRQSTRAGLVGLRDTMRSQAESIRSQRAANGLPNR